MDDEVQVGNSGSIAAQDFLKDGWRRREVKIEMPLGAIIHAGPYGPCHLVPPHAILAIRDNAYLSLRASPPLSCYRLNVLVGTAILVPDDREHFALLSVGLDQPGYDLETGAVRRTPTFDESSVDANDHLLRRLIGFAIFGDLLSNLFVDALSNCDQPGSGGGMVSSTRRWEKYSQQICSLAI